MASEIHGMKEVEKALGPIRYFDYTFVHQLWFSIDHDTQLYRLELELRTDEHANSPGLVLKFDGVTGLEVKGLGYSPTQITGFALDDISERGLEGLNWEGSD